MDIQDSQANEDMILLLMAIIEVGREEPDFQEVQEVLAVLEVKAAEAEFIEV